MDNITHAAFGALVGEVTLGRKIGNKALGWGALAATIPDFDVFGNPFITAAAALEIHRGFTHSLFFAPIAAPILGYLVWRLYLSRGSPAAQVGWKGWAILFFGGLLSHPLLDTLTVYGTQLFLPFSSHGATITALFILDPVYLLVLLVGVIAVFRLARDREARRYWAWGAMGVSTLYVVAAMGIKLHTERVVAENLERQEIDAQRVLTVPTALNTVLRYVLVDAGETLYVGYYGIFDPDRHIEFRRYDRRTKLLEPYEGTRSIETLRWFSRDYFIVRPNQWVPREVELQPLGVVVYDARFGRHDAHLDPDDNGRWLYSFHLAEKPDGMVTFRRPIPGFDVRRLPQLIRRIRGDRSVHEPFFSSADPQRGPSEAETNVTSSGPGWPAPRSD